MADILSEVRTSLRALRRAPGFTATVIATLGIGMALCALTLALLDAYLWRGFPYAGADRLYSVQYGQPGQSPPRGMEGRDWTSLDDLVEHPVAWDLDMFYLLGREHTEQVSGAWVTPGFMEAFGIRPVLGRGFDAEAFTSGGPNVAIISHALWTTQFGGDADAIGRTFTAYVSDRPDEAETFTIVGVLPAGFWHFNPFTSVLVPLRAPTYPYFVRLRPHASPQDVAARISGLVSDAGAAPVPVRLEPAHGRYTATVRPMLRAAMTAAALVLLVACANVAGLLLVRAAARERDLAVRVALGAGRLALIRSSVAEAALLVTSASVLAIVVAAMAISWLGPTMQEHLGRSAPGGLLAISGRTAAIIGIVGLATTLICALVPVMGMRLLKPSVVLAQAGRTSTAGGASQRTRTALIVAQVAISLSLLTGATLMLRTVSVLTAMDWGIASGGVTTTGLALRQSRYPNPSDRAHVFDRLLTSLRAMPGVASVGLTSASLTQQPRLIDVGTDTTDVGVARTSVHVVSDGYFSTLGIPIVTGRPIERDDVEGREAVVVVSATLARRLWRDDVAIGKRVVTLEEDDEDEPRRVVRTTIGVAADVRQGGTDEEQADVYVPLMQQPGRFASAIVRMAVTPGGASVDPDESLRRAVRDVDPEIAIDRIRPLQDLMAADMARPRFMSALLSTLALAASVLALVGLYGLVAYAVRQREREIAIRVAIGAGPGRITRLFLGPASVVLVVGLTLGIGGALMTGRLLATQLVGVTSADPLALAGSCVAFALVALVATWWPSRHAASTDPAQALRSA